MHTTTWRYLSLSLAVAGSACLDLNPGQYQFGDDAGAPMAGCSRRCETPPQRRCLDGQTLESFPSVGQCTAQGCSYSPVNVRCGVGCADAGCVNEACAGIFCDRPPAPSCDDATHLRVFDSAGACGGGSCSYGSRVTACTCADGGCVDDLCAGVTCGQPPASACIDSKTLRIFSASGTCAAGSCSYTPSGVTCAFGCNDGACANDPCAGKQCTQPPSATCVNDTTRRVSMPTGTCTAGSCSYATNDVPCGANEVCTLGMCHAVAPSCTAANCSDGCCDGASCIRSNDQTNARCGSSASTCGGCGSGFQCTSGACVDIDECATANGGCDANATCTNTPGGRTCTCHSGYASDGGACGDIDECATSNGGCDVNAVCTNTSGGHTCACAAGYSGDGGTCSDIDECATANGGCDSNATCVNTAGGRTCTCKSGYAGDGGVCGDINECAIGNGGCAVNASCTNTVGGRTCACLDGYTGDGVTSCTPLCATNHGGCSSNATCTDGSTGRTCTCMLGYAGDGITCTWSGCPNDMATVSATACVDKYEASQGASGQALSVASATPWVSITTAGAIAACAAAGKHLCSETEWKTACSGPSKTVYPYSNTYSGSACNGLDKGIGHIAPTGSVSTCQGGFSGVYDMSGNAYERTSSCSNGNCRVEGGSYRSSSGSTLLKCTTGFDFTETSPDDAVGFRCCL